MSRFHFSDKNARFAVITFRTGSLVEKNGVAVSIKFLVLRRLTEDTGLEIDREVMQDLSVTSGSVRGRTFDSEVVFDGLDFSFVERTKQLDVVHRAFALSQYIKGSQTISTNPVAAEQFFLRGYFVLEKVLEASPLDPWLTALMADLCCGLWTVLSAQVERLGGSSKSGSDVSSIVEHRELVSIFEKKAEKFYAEALSESPVVAVLRNYSIFLLRCGRVAEAENNLNKALSLCNDDGGTLNGALVSEWELIGELSDLLKECHDTKTAGPVRKNSTVSPIPQKESSSDDKTKKKLKKPILSLNLRKFGKREGSVEDSSTANTNNSNHAGNSLNSSNITPLGSSMQSISPHSSFGSPPTSPSIAPKHDHKTMRGSRKLTESASGGFTVDEEGERKAEEARLAQERHFLLKVLRHK